MKTDINSSLNSDIYQTLALAFWVRKLTPIHHDTSLLNEEIELLVRSEVSKELYGGVENHGEQS